MKILSAILALFALILFTRNISMLFFHMDNYNTHRKRLKQLQFGNKKKDKDPAEIVDSITKPIIKYVLPKLKPKNLDQLAVDLKMAKWEKTFTPIQYRALSFALKILGVVLFLLFVKASAFMAIIWLVILFFGMNFLLNNSIKNRKEALLQDFPDFIRIVEGYLSANVPFAQAVAESIRYTGAEWQPILLNFITTCDVRSVDAALEELKDSVDMFEVREFVSLVRLTLEQGGEVRDSFLAQAEKIREMQIDIIAMKIGKRQMMGIAIQAPLLLCDLLVFGLPTFGSMANFSSM